jgi:hypothetical protein
LGGKIFLSNSKAKTSDEGELIKKGANAYLKKGCDLGYSSSCHKNKRYLKYLESNHKN